MDATTLTAGAALGAALLLVAHEAWRLRMYDDRDALWRAGFAVLVATVAMTGLAAAQGSPEAAAVRGLVVLFGTPVLLRVLGLAIDERPPDRLQLTLVAIGVVAVPIVLGTDLYVTGELTDVGTPALGPLFRLLSVPPVVATAAWALHVVRRSTNRLDRVVLGIGIGLPSVASTLLLLDPSGRDALWVGVLSPLLVATEIARWRSVRADLDHRDRISQHRAALSRELTEANAQLRAALRTRDELLAATSHELRTPLTAVIGFVETLRAQEDRLDAARRRRYLDVLHANAGRLQRLVEELLAARSLSGTVLPPSRGPVSLQPVLQDCVEAFAELADEADITCAGDLVVDADAVHLHRMLAALLENAAAHGRPPVSVRATAVHDTVELLVADAGPGLPPDLVERAFEPFVQGSTGPGRRTGGIGLGLYNAAALAELGGGTLAWADCDGDGTGAFRLVLPRWGGPAGQAATGPDALAPAGS